MKELALGAAEKIIFDLRALYNTYGYSQYKMSKFEAYDLYAKNKDFLICDSVITFTDADGKLMALKPDVTLSIVKNSRDTAFVQKLYYTENVYRVAKGERSFRERMQVGLECLGPIDDYCLCEVLELAAKSLQSISSSSVLNVSHLGILTALLEGMGISGAHQVKVFSLLGQKNLHELCALCRELGAAQEDIDLLRALIAITGTPSEVLPQLACLLDGKIDPAPLAQLVSVTAPLSDAIRIDFSVVDDIHYYNGIVFKGFIEGLPQSVLSGGQYDRLMQKLGRKTGAVGFAVYMDVLERLQTNTRQYDVDTVLVYDAATPAALIREKAAELASSGSVLVQPCVPENIRYQKLVSLKEGQVHILENNA